MASVKSFFKEESGSDLVAFTMLAPVFILLFAMLISFAQGMYGAQVALNAASTGVRAASIQNSPDDAKKAANDIAATYIERAGMGVTFVSDNLEYSTWERKKVCNYYVTISVKTAFPLKLGGIDKNFLITRPSVALIEKE